LAYAGHTETLPQIRSDAPDQYVIVKGDTLWGISGKFFKDPWRWPYIWGMNKDAIKDPHWIYPGETIVLDRANGTLSIGGKSAASHGEIIRLSPQMRPGESTRNAISSIPSAAIEPFLSQPLVVADALLAGSPTVVGLPEDRVIAGNGDVMYASGLTEEQGKKWQVFRPGKTLIDPDSKEVLGHEAIYLGSAEVSEFANVSRLVITHADQEINPGDRLVAPAATVAHTYLPRAPENQINATVISIYGGVTQAGQNTVITLNKGERDGVQSGHVLALSSKGGTVKSEGKNLALPDEHNGLLFVFRVFDKVSYALVMQTRLPVQLLDHAQTP
jgi:hypothetical protein